MWTTGTSTDLQLDLFAGDGDGGALLGSSSVLTILNTVSAATHFDFASTVALTPGALYSFRLTHLGGAAAYLDVTGNNYAGGIPRNPDGSAFTSFDLVFTEGLHRSAPVPAPATLALFGLGLAGLGWSRRKKA